MAVGTTVALDADGPDVGEQHYRHLPDVAVQAGVLQLLAGDRVGAAQDGQAVLGDRSDDPDGQAGARERLAPHHRLGQAELSADRADLVLEQCAQRLDQLELQVVGQATDVVVGLDVRRPLTAAGLHHVGVQRPLGQELDRLVGVDLTGGHLERPDELPADDLALGLRVDDPVELAEEHLGDVLHHQAYIGGRDEILLDLLGLALTEQAVVDEDAHQLVADRAVQQGGRDGRVDAAGQPAQHALVADDRTDLRDRVIDDVRRGPVRRATGDLVEEVLQDLLAVLGVHNLGVPLDAGQLALDVLERRNRGTCRTGQRGEAGSGGVHRVAVAHPGAERRGDLAQQRSRGDDGGLGPAELRQPGTGHVAAQRRGHRLEAVADAEDRDPRLEQRRVDLGGTLGVHRLRAARQDDRLGVAGGDLGGRGGVRHDLGEDARLADPARDQLRVLRAEIDDDDGVMGLRACGTARASGLPWRQV